MSRVIDLQASTNAMVHNAERKKLNGANPDNYGKKIKAIQNYFNVSKNAAKYLFHRRRRGSPFKHDDDPNFMPWTTQLQNALVKADRADQWDWKNTTFECEISALQDANILISDQKITVHTNSVIDTDSDWTVVTGKVKRNKPLLRSIGMLPRLRKIY